jgi:hypothetical protein
MNPQLIKEFRALLFPWSVAVVIAIIIPPAAFFIGLRVFDGGAFLTFLLTALTFAFFANLLVLTALPFGIEFQHQTFALLLSQPLPRAQIWKRKLFAASLAVVIPIAILALGNWIAQSADDYIFRIRVGEVIGNWPWGTALCALALLVPTLGSVGFWTLLARSTLGGIVFTASAQLIAFGLIAFVGEKIDIPARAQLPLLTIIGVIYGAIFFMLSWRKFARLELSHVSSIDSAGAKSLTARPSRFAWLRCRPTSGLLNLVRKEIQLQRPLFIIAGILLVLWVLAYIFILLLPSRTNFAEIIFALTIGFYIPLMSLLAGSVSLGEEKNLAIVGWHLTFPISVWRQWWVKLAVGFGAWALLGFLLPFCLIRVGMVISGPRIFNEVEPQAWLAISLFMTGVYALSFWAMTLFSNTVRAIIAAIVIVIAICGSAALAFWLVAGLMDMRPFGSPPLLLAALTAVLALLQSRIRMQRLETSCPIIIRYSCLLMAVTFLVFVGYMCLCV